MNSITVSSLAPPCSSLAERALFHIREIHVGRSDGHAFPAFWSPCGLGNNASLFPVLAIVQSLSFCLFVRPGAPSVTAAYFGLHFPYLGRQLTTRFKYDSLIDYIDVASLLYFPGSATRKVSTLLHKLPPALHSSPHSPFFSFPMFVSPPKMPAAKRE